jgi:hypothetical protein
MAKIGMAALVVSVAAACVPAAMAGGPDPSPAAIASGMGPDPAPAARAQPPSVRPAVSVTSPRPVSSEPAPVSRTVRPHAAPRPAPQRPHRPPQLVVKRGFRALLHRLAPPVLGRHTPTIAIEPRPALSRDELLLVAAALGAVALASGSLLTLNGRGHVRKEA